MGNETFSELMNGLMPTRLRRGAASPPESDTPAAERLSRLLADREQAARGNDAKALAAVEDQIDRLLTESAAEQTEQPGFDGGVRGGRQFRPPGMRQPPTASQLLVQSLEQHRVERAQRAADPGQRIIANF